MTYGDLLERLYALSPSKLQEYVTIEFQGDFFSTLGFMPDGHENEDLSDVVENQVPIIVVNA